MKIRNLKVKITDSGIEAVIKLIPVILSLHCVILSAAKNLFRRDARQCVSVARPFAALRVAFSFIRVKLHFIRVTFRCAKPNSHFSLLTSHSPGFTLFEILIAIFIFGIVMTTIFGSFVAVFSSTDAIFDGINDYDMAKNCLNRMITDLQTVHISPREIYMRPEFDDPPDPYRIVGDTGYSGTGSFSRLRFTSRSHLTLEKNMQKGIAEIVYYVRTRGDNENILTRADSLFPYKRFEGKTFEENTGDPVLCEKVRSLAFKYYDEEGTEYDHWDSESEEFRYATPKAIQIKLEFGDDSSSLLFETMVRLPVYREKAG